MKIIKRVLSFLLVLMLLLPAAAQAKELTYQATGFSLAFEAGEQLPEAVSSLLNMLTLSGTCTWNKKYSDIQGSLQLNGNAKTNTDFHLQTSSVIIGLSSSLIGDQKLYLQMGAAGEYAAKMYNHLGLKEFSAAALCFPYVTSKGTKTFLDTVKAFFASGKKTKTISRQEMLELAEQITALTENDGRLYYWLSAVYCACPEIGSRLYNLAENLQEIVDGMLTQDTVTVKYKKYQYTLVCGDKTWMVYHAKTGNLTLSLPLGEQNFELALDNKTGTLSIHWTDGADTVLDLAASIPELPKLPTTPGTYVAAVELSGLAVGGETLRLVLTNTMAENGALDCLITCNDSKLLRITGTLEDLGTEKRSMSSSKITSGGVGVFSLNDATLKKLVNEIKEPLLIGALPLLTEMPASTVGTVMDFLDRGGIFDIAAASFGKSDSGDTEAENDDSYVDDDDYEDEYEDDEYPDEEEEY